MEPEISPEKSIWSNVNIAEVLPGINPPLVTSVVTVFFDKFVTNIFGISQNIKVIQPIKGRLYFNTTLLGKEMAKIFGTEAISFTSMFGGGQAQTQEILHKAGFKSKLKLGWFGLHLVISSFFVQRQFAKAVKEIDIEADNYTRRIAQAKNLEELLIIEKNLFNYINQMFTKGLKSLMLPFGNYFAFVSLCKEWFSESPTANQFLANGGNNIQIIQAFKDLWLIAQEIKKYPEIEKQFLTNDNLATQLNLIKKIPQISGLYKAWMNQYGYRSIKELDFSLPRWQEDPTFVIQMLKKYLVLDENQNPINKQKTIIAKQEAQIRNAHKKLSYFQYRKFFKMLRQVEDIQAKREQAKSEMVKLLAILRELYLKIGDYLIEAGYYNNPTDIFMFEREEIIKLSSNNLAGKKEEYCQKLNKRKIEYENYKQIKLPDVISDLENIQEQIIVPQLNGILKGIAASGGNIEGIARVIFDISEINRIEPNDILVTDHTDPCWTPVFVIISGVITNTGGPLSHASIVAREYGLPAVVNVRGATQIIKDGQKLRLNGDDGTVEILS